jgi:seryl-tRNA synthetase
LRDALRRSEAAAANLVDEDMAAVKAQLADIDTINAKVRQNLEKHQAEDEAEALKVQYKGATAAIEAMRAERLKLLAGVAMPLPDLSIDEDGEVVFKNRKWDGMSHSEQLRVSVAICAQVKPACGFVLLDKLEALDVQTMQEFGDWLASKGLQCIATRVSTGDECSLIIEDGMVATKPVTRKYAV